MSAFLVSHWLALSVVGGVCCFFAFVAWGVCAMSRDPEPHDSY